MVYALSGFALAMLIALWSLAVWALHGAAVWAVSNAGTLSGATAGSGALALPAWLAPWVPPELTTWALQLLAGLGALVEGLLQAAPPLAGALTAAAWVVWGLGCLVLLLVGAGLYLLVALSRRRSRQAGARVGPAAASAT